MQEQANNPQQTLHQRSKQFDTGYEKYSESPKFDASSKKKEPFHRVMVVDIGSLFVKYMLIVSFNGEDDYIVRAEIKYFDKFNYHLFSRDLKRRIDKFSRYGIDKIIILPKKDLCAPVCLPRFEYQDDTKVLRDEVKNAVRDTNGVSVKYTHDWSLLIDDPDNDVQSIFVETLPEAELFSLGTSLVELKLKNFLISSPTLGYVELVDDKKPHLIVDIGNTTTRLTIVKNGAIYLSTSLAIGGSSVTQDLAENSRSPHEAMIYKQNSTYRDLGTSVNNLVDSLRTEMQKIQEDYETRYIERVADYIIVGGSAALQFEEELNATTIGLDRFYPKMKLANDAKLPSETRNYFYGCYSAYKFYMRTRNHKASTIDMMSPKSGIVGLKVREFLALYDKHRTAFYSVVAILVGLNGGYIIENIHTSKLSLDINTFTNQYNAKLQNLNEQSKQLEAQHQQLVGEATARKGKNTGDLLAKIGDIAGTDISIRNLKLQGDGEVAYFDIVSNSQKSISNYIVLLTDQCFNRAIIESVSVDETKTGTVYKTTVRAEGRKL